MNKYEISVPIGYRYLSQWNGLLNILPQSGKYIVNKVRTGCGGTTLFLESDQPCILVSPRINMLLSKHKQYPKTFLFCSEDKDSVLNRKQKLKAYLDSCSAMTPWGQNHNIPKILTTVDSYKYVAEELQFMGCLDKYIVLIDEFQCLMSDAAFKGNVELTFLHNLSGMKSACFLSATPIPEDYLNEMDDFLDVENYYQLIWDSSVLEPSNLLSIPYKKGESSRSICKRIIEEYRTTGYFAQKIIDNRIVQSHEVCIFLNDVKSIINIIRDNLLDPNEVNVLCSRGNVGVDTLRHMGVHVGELCTDPNNPHNRTFIFCSKAAFEGLDLFSDNAYTYIFSDGVLDWNRHDIIIDVPQILGRQRLASNPFRADATLYYRTKSTTESIENAINRIREKENATTKWIDQYNNATDEIKQMLVDGIRKVDADKRYDDHYVDVVDDALHGGFIVKPNYLIRNVEVRDWQLSSFVYSNPIYLIKAVEDACSTTHASQLVTEEDLLLLQFKEQFFNYQRSTSRRLEIYCSFLQTYPNAIDELLKNPHIPLFMHEAYHFLGPERLSKLQYQEKSIQAELDFVKAKDQIIQRCSEVFQRGQDYPLSQVKVLLQSIYTSLGLSQTACASDLVSYLSITKKQITTSETGKRDLYYHIE